MSFVNVALDSAEELEPLDRAEVCVDWLDERPRILVVDDDEDQSALIASFLDGAGFQAICAGDGVSALQTAMTNVVDLVLLDVMMPGLDGHETCRRLMSGLLDSRVPVIMITGLKLSDSRSASFESGAVAHLVKPVRSSRLLSLVRSLL